MIWIFLTPDEFNIESIISEIRKTGNSFGVISEGEGYLITSIDGIKVSIFKYDYPFIEKTLSYKGIQIAAIADIAAMIVIALSQRGVKREFVGLYVILQNMPFLKIAENMVKKFGIERVNPVHIGKSLVYFSDAEFNLDPEYIKGENIKWKSIKVFFKEHVKQFVLDLNTAVKGISP